MYELVRPAVAADRQVVEDIVRRAYEPWAARIGTRPAPLDADYGSLIADGLVYVAGSADVDGLIVLVPEDDVLLIDNVAVRPERQGSGVGHELLGFAEAEARRRGLPAVRLFTHGRMPRNLTLYESLGYVVTRYEPIDLGHLVHLRKDLT